MQITRTMAKLLATFALGVALTFGLAGTASAGGNGSGNGSGNGGVGDTTTTVASADVGLPRTGSDATLPLAAGGALAALALGARQVARARV